MPKTDINTILKNGKSTILNGIDYSHPRNKQRLKDLKKKSETALKNKEVNEFKLSRLIIR